MSPLPTSLFRTNFTPSHLQKRDYEATAWRAIGAGIGVFVFIGLIGVLAGIWRHRMHKTNQGHASTAQKGAYSKLEDDAHRSLAREFDHLPRPKAIGAMRTSRSSSASSVSSSSTSSIGSTTSTGDERAREISPDRRIHSRSVFRPQQQQQRQKQRIQGLGAYSAVVYLEGPADTDKAYAPRGRSHSLQPNIESSALDHGTFAPAGSTLLLPPPPPAAHVDSGLGVLHYHAPDRVRSVSPEDRVLSRSASMLRPQSSLPDKKGLRY